MSITRIKCNFLRRSILCLIFVPLILMSLCLMGLRGVQEMVAAIDEDW